MQNQEKLMVQTQNKQANSGPAKGEEGRQDVDKLWCCKINIGTEISQQNMKMFGMEIE